VYFWSHILIKNLKIMPFFRMFQVILLLKNEFISKFENLGKLVANGTTPGTYVKLKIVVDFSTRIPRFYRYSVSLNSFLLFISTAISFRRAVS
jgi:hypothetical protein